MSAVVSFSSDAVAKSILNDLPKKTGTNIPAVTVDNFLQIIMKDPYFTDKGLRYNILTGELVKTKGTLPEVWDEIDRAEAMRHIENEYGLYHEKKYDCAVAAFCKGAAYNPIAEKVLSLKWDGVQRIETGILQRWLNVPDSPYVRECARLLFAGLVHRAIAPGSKFDYMVVFIGKQGCGKSTFCRWLAMSDDLYVSLKTIDAKKAAEIIAGKLIVEIEELAAILPINTRAETKTEAEIKAFLSTDKERFRAAYARQATDHPRSNIFVATTNEHNFLTDWTGNRRWFPVQVESDPEFLYQHKSEIQHDIEQAVAEMAVAYNADSPFANAFPAHDLLEEIENRQKKAMVEDPRVGVIDDFIHSGQRSKTCVPEVWRELCRADLEKGDLTTIKSREIGRILRGLGCTAENVSSFPGYGRQKTYKIP